jgi:hypothetical protein
VLQATNDAAVVHELEAIEAKLASAWKNRDCAGWGALLADDWSVTHIDAQVITKAQALEMCRTGPPVTSSVDQIAIRVYGDTAIVTGRTKAIVGEPQGRPEPGRRMTAAGATPQTITLRFTDVFVRRDRRWLAVASHATRAGD